MTEDNGNIGLLKPQNSSNEDLSEYTDADESISAPTEFLAEFLSAVMLKDYVTALKYCKLILQYEPNNATAKEFYPLILVKLKQMKDLTVNTGDNKTGGGGGSGSSEGDDDEDDDNPNSSSSSSDSESSSESTSDSSEEEDEEQADEEEGLAVGRNSDKQSKGSSDGDGTTGSYSSLEDDEGENDRLAALAAKYQNDNVNLGNGNKIYTTDKLPVNPSITNNILSGNGLPFGTSSDSESPTEPVSQQTVQMVNMLRTRVVPTKH